MKQWLIVLGLFTISFKDITRFENFSQIERILKETKKVSSFVMTKAQRGNFEYEGNFGGTPEELIEILQIGAGATMTFETGTQGENLTILVTPKLP